MSKIHLNKGTVTMVLLNHSIGVRSIKFDSVKYVIIYIDLAHISDRID